MLFVIECDPARAEIIPNTLNSTETNGINAALTSCMDGLGSGNGQDFQDRCNAVFGSPTVQGVTLAADQISPEQTIAPGTQTTRANASGIMMASATIKNRLLALREGTQGTRYAG